MVEALVQGWKCSAGATEVIRSVLMHVAHPHALPIIIGTLRSSKDNILEWSCFHVRSVQHWRAGELGLRTGIRHGISLCGTLVESGSFIDDSLRTRC